MSDAPRRQAFVETRWSLVLATRDPRSRRARSALATLCETYWTPVYAFIRHSGHQEDDARDLTQAFVRVLEKGEFGDARPERGRFRAFLLASVRHFLSNQYDRARTVKRGGRAVHVPLDVKDGEAAYTIEPADHLTPETLYERRWALAALDDALARVRAKQTSRGRHVPFDELRPFLTGDEPASYRDLAVKLRVTESSLRVAVHRLRHQFGTCLREAIAETVARPEDVDEELRYLLSVVSG